MADLYNFDRHTHCAFVNIRDRFVDIRFRQSSDRDLRIEYRTETSEDACIIYDNGKVNVRCFGNDCRNYTSIDSKDASHALENNDIRVDNFLDKLHLVSRKNKNTWNEDDKFAIKAVSDFLKLLLEKKTAQLYETKHLNFDSYHYAIAVPSEWEEETRKDLIQTIFNQANLTSKDDHRDRIIISSNIECFFMDLIKMQDFKRSQNILVFKRTTINQETVLINLDLVIMSNTRFDFAGSELYPTVKYSTSLSITVDYIKNCIKDFLIDKLFSIDENNYQIIETLVDEIYYSVDNSCYGSDYVGENENEEFKMSNSKLMTPVFINSDRWNLKPFQKNFLNFIRPSDLCAIFGKPLFDNIKNKILSYRAKKYEYLNVRGLNDELREELDPILRIWLNYILKWNIQLLNEKKNTITKFKLREKPFKMYLISDGLCNIVMETVKNSCMYGLPQINSVDYSNESSLFFNLRPDVIINIDISLNRTLLKCSLFNDDALAQNVFDHNHLTTEKSLPSLQTFYNVSNVPSITIDKSFIPFAKRNLWRIAKKHFFGVLKKLLFRKADFLHRIELMLNKAQSTKNNSIAITQQKKYIRAFLLMYIIYIKEIISSRLSIHADLKNTEMKVGFAISIEKMLLDTIVGSKEELRELVYASGLIKKDDAFKKLRINTQGEGVLSSIKQLLEVNFPLRSNFVLTQIHEDYIQLTLNQVITASNFENQQETIIIKDKIIYIQNVFTSLCSYIWNNLVKNLSFIQLCNKHQETDHKELYTIKTMKKITKQLKQYILVNILTENSNCQTFYKNAFKLRLSCSCKIFMTTHDIIDTAFRPFLKDIHSTMSSAVINEDIFGRYKNIDYHFSLICFNYNAHFQKIITHILEEEARCFNPMRGIDTVFKTIPALKVRSFPLKDFQTGALHQVYNENYVFTIQEFNEKIPLQFYKKEEKKRTDLYFKWKETDKQNILLDENVGYHFLTAGDMISRNKVDKTAYIYNSDDNEVIVKIAIYKYRTSNDTKDAAFLERNETWEEVLSEEFYPYYNEALCIKFTAEHIGYSSSIKFSIRDVCERSTPKTFEIGIPMTLSRF